jgi:hypothetical protein
MRILRFTFKNEAVWMMILSLGLLLIGLVLALVVFLARK